MSTLTGTPAELQITSNGSIQDFRRYDITSGQGAALWPATATANTVRSITCFTDFFAALRWEVG